MHYLKRDPGYRSPTIDNFSQPTLQIKDGGQCPGELMYIIGTNFPDFQDDSGILTYESGEDGARRLRELQGISTSEVCTNLVRVNETHLLCELKPRIDLTPARCRDVEIVVAWGSLKTHMQSVPLRLPEPLISEAHDVTPNQPWPVEVGEAILYRLEGLNFGNWENGKIQVMVGDRTCAVSGREDTNVLCTTAGPLRDDLQDLYPETPENNSFGDVEVVIPMPIWLTMGASATEASEDCEPLAANWSYQVRLKSCPAGQFRQSHRSDTCAECSPGHFSPVAGPFLSCLDCGEASYANLPGAFACLDCPAGRLTGKNATASALDCKCAPGRFLAQAPRRAELSVLEAVKRNAADFLGSYQLEPCESCPSGSTCAGALAPPVANPGWWMMSGDLPVRCTLGGCLGNNTCAPGYDARTRCETCTVTFYMDLMESACKQCEDWVAFFAIIYGCAAFVLLFGFVFPFISWKSRVALDPGRGVAPPKLCFGLCHCCLRRFAARRRLLRADYVDMSQYQDQLWKRTRRVLQKIRVLYHSPMRRLVEGAELQPLVNILLNNVQTFVLLANIGYRSWPAPTKFILDLGLLMVSNVESLRPACVAPIGADGRWYLLFSLPYLLYASCILFVLCRQRESSRRRRVMLMISGGFTLYLSPVFLLTAAAVFDCVDSGDGSRVLDLDRSIVCWGDGVWKQMFALAVLQFLLLALLLAFVGFSVYRSYMWYRVAEVGMQPPSAVFLTWWWLAGSRGISLKHRAAIQGYKVHLDLPSNLTQASEVSSLCDDLLLQNVGNLKSGIERLKDYLQGFRVDDVDALKRPRRRGQNVCEHCQGCGKSMHDKHQHQHQHVEVGCGFCGRGKEDPWQMRSSMRKAAYSRLSLRLEQLLLQLRTMSSFSETSASLNDLFAFMWELLVLVHKTSLGTVRLLVSQDARSGLQISLLLCVAYLGLALVVKPYRHDGLNWLEGYFAVMKVVLVFTMVQLDDYGENTIVTVFCITLVALALASVLLMLPAWGFYALWRSAFTESFYVMVTEEVQGQNWRGPSSPRETRMQMQRWQRARTSPTPWLPEWCAPATSCLLGSHWRHSGVSAAPRPARNRSTRTILAKQALRNGWILPWSRVCPSPCGSRPCCCTS
ncbi:unnamed protein product [Effrenium voratum]|nr:unnamed protein product [Effrenium voratum]